MKTDLPVTMLKPYRPRESGTWYVYGLFDSRDPKRPFYVGMTGNFEGRAAGHIGGWVSKALAQRRLEIEKSGAHCTMRALRSFVTPKGALAHERRLINRLSGLVNALGRDKAAEALTK